MTIEEYQTEDGDELSEKEMANLGDHNGKNDKPTPLKVSDDSNSDEILVFTSHHNVYKVQKKEINDKFKALQKIDFEEGERPIYLTGNKNYSGFLIAAFENGKVGKIAMDSYRTDYKRKKLRNAFNSGSKLIFIERFSDDIDLVALSNINKVVLFNTSQINAVESRTTMGVQVMKQKSSSTMIKVKKAAQTRITDPEYYRKGDGLNVVGYYLKPGDEI